MNPRTRTVVAVTADGTLTLRGQDTLPFSDIPEVAGLHLTVAELFAAFP